MKTHKAMARILNLFAMALICIGAFTSCNSPEKKESPKQIVKRVILIGSDGFGGYAFKKAKTPNIRKLMTQGSYSLKARAVLPSSSAVNWASMIMGSGPELHGYTEWGSKTPELPSRVIGKGNIYPSIFSLIDKQLPDSKKGVSYTWDGIGHLFEKNMVDLDYNGKSDVDTKNKAMEFFVKEKPSLTFIHFDEPDGTGHNIGHDTPEYYAAVEKIDTLIGDIINTLKKNDLLNDTAIIFSSDHGGIDKGHGGKTLLEVEIPWIIHGKNLPAKGKLKSSIVTYDTATTIAHLLGLEVPDFWRGKNVDEVFSKKN